MEVYKFGGASVKDAEGVRNFLSTLQQLDLSAVLIVISAMGKMTNAFEGITNSYFFKRDDFSKRLEEAQLFHLNIVQDLGFSEYHQINSEIDLIFNDIHFFIKKNNVADYDYVYDQLVSAAELLSTKICSAYLHMNQIDNEWLDARVLIKTDSDFRRARLDWDRTCQLINQTVDRTRLTITQGFIGSDSEGRTTTLGREGSDYTAGIFAYCLDADRVSIFKDVQGVLNADPKEFEHTTLIEKVSYTEAIEMAFYGASVIHPKTLQPLQRKSIPLKVRSFIDVNLKGTLIEKGLHIVPKTPCFVVKKDQLLISVSDKDFNFVVEEDISEIFKLLHEFKLKVNLIQNSAISFSVCVEDNFGNFKNLINALSPKYKVKYNKGLTLYTIRHFDEEAISKIENYGEVLLIQKSRETIQLIINKQE